MYILLNAVAVVFCIVSIAAYQESLDRLHDTMLLRAIFFILVAKLFNDVAYEFKD